MKCLVMFDSTFFNFILFMNKIELYFYLFIYFTYTHLIYIRIHHECLFWLSMKVKQYKKNIEK